MPGLRVAVDVTPLLGVRAGVYQCVANLLRVLPDACPDIEVVPYVLSRAARRAGGRLPAGTRFLTVPAGVAIRMWGIGDRPSVDGILDDVDVVHGTNFVVPPTRKPSSVTVHDAFCLAHPNECEPAVRPFGRALRRALARGAWLHVSTSAVETQLVSLYGATRIARVPFGMPPLAEPGPLPDGVNPPYILSMSTLDARKRHEHLVGAFRLLAGDDEHLRLVIAGADGNAREAILQAIGALPPDVGPRVLLVGRVDDATRAALVHGATVLAYPSTDEGFGFPVLEAMAAGVPVVASDVGGIPEVAGGAAVLVPVDDDPRALVAALRRVLTDAGLRDRMRRDGLARVGTFTWERHATGMADLWRRAASETTA